MGSRSACALTLNDWIYFGSRMLACDIVFVSQYVYITSFMLSDLFDAVRLVGAATKWRRNRS